MGASRLQRPNEDGGDSTTYATEPRPHSVEQQRGKWLTSFKKGVALTEPHETVLSGRFSLPRGVFLGNCCEMSESTVEWIGQARGGWKTEDDCPVGGRASSWTVRPCSDVIGSRPTVHRIPHWSKRWESGMVVGSGNGTRFEQLGLEQDGGRFGPSGPNGSLARSFDSEADESPKISVSSWLKARNRWDREVTRWLQPAWAGRGSMKPWTKSSSAPVAHRDSRSILMDLITTSPSSGKPHARGNPSRTRHTETQITK
jgi:hypothetical protein